MTSIVTGWSRFPGVSKVGEACTIFAVLVGAAQYANNYLGIRKAPNAKLVFTPCRGFNEGSLQILIHTRNGAGIAKGFADFVGLRAGIPCYAKERPRFPGCVGSSVRRESGFVAR
jgi:hypothetical protein